MGNRRSRPYQGCPSANLLRHYPGLKATPSKRRGMVLLPDIACDWSFCPALARRSPLRYSLLLRVWDSVWRVFPCETKSPFFGFFCSGDSGPPLFSQTEWRWVCRFFWDYRSSVNSQGPALARHRQRASAKHNEQPTTIPFGQPAITRKRLPFRCPPPS